jgi:large subunit ribosomal protein L3
MKFILGKKMPMTQIWDNDKVLAVTPVLAGPCVITQVKTKKTDKYSALQLAFGERKVKNLNKPQRAKFAKVNVSPMHVREFRLEQDIEAKAGDQITVESFAAGDVIDVAGTSKGKGFQGVVKRHGFKGGRKSHGNKDQLRMPGSIGPKGPAHVFKGMKMGGRMGNSRVTIQNLSIASVDVENNIIYIKGAVPGPIEGLLYIKGKGDLVIKEVKALEEKKEEEKAEEVKAEEVKVEEVKVEEKKEEKAEEVKTEDKKEEVKKEKVEEKSSEEDKKVTA